MKKKIKNAIILTITGAMFAIWCVAVCAIDSATPIPFCAFVASSIWLILFAWANDFFKSEE